MQIDKAKQIEMRRFHCTQCKAHLASYGSFNPLSAPEYKELRIENCNVYLQDSKGNQQYRVDEIWNNHPVTKKMSRIGVYMEVKCKPCETINKIQVIFRPYQQFMGMKGLN